MGVGAIKTYVAGLMSFALCSGALQWMTAEAVSAAVVEHATGEGPQPQPLRSEAEEIVRNTLNGMNSYGWDVTRKGILINWRRPDPSQVQCHPGKCEPADATQRHDALNDVRTLQSLYWYKARNPQDHAYDTAIARLAPSVHDRYDHTQLAKGYLYPVLLRLSEYADTPAERAGWAATMQGWAAGQVKHIDPAAGVQHRPQGNCDCGAKTIYLDDAYRVGAEVENGAALIHAGSVFNKPEWVAAGYREVHVAYEQAFSKEYHVFGRVYVFSDKKYGKNLLWDTQAEPNDVSEEADLLLRAGLVVKDHEMQQFLLNLVGEMLNALRTLPFHDKVHGGFVSAIYVADQYDGHKKGEVRASGREARQLSLLGTLALANRSLKPLNQWADLEAEMLRMTLHSIDDPQPGMRLPDTVEPPAPIVNGYPASTGGYMYQITPDFKLVQHPDGAEDWISAEADNLVLIGLHEP